MNTFYIANKTDDLFLPELPKESKSNESNLKNVQPIVEIKNSNQLAQEQKTTSNNQFSISVISIIVIFSCLILFCLFKTIFKPKRIQQEYSMPEYNVSAEKKPKIKKEINTILQSTQNTKNPLDSFDTPDSIKDCINLFLERTL